MTKKMRDLLQDENDTDSRQEALDDVVWQVVRHGTCTEHAKDNLQDSADRNR